MSPEEARDLFSEAYDGELSSEQEATFHALVATDEDLQLEYESFCLFVGRTSELSVGDAPEIDLLAGVQAKIRQRSGGRFYRDRFAMKSGPGRMTPLMIALVMFGVLTIALLGMSMVLPS